MKKAALAACACFTAIGIPYLLEFFIEDSAFLSHRWMTFMGGVVYAELLREIYKQP